MKREVPRVQIHFVIEVELSSTVKEPVHIQPLTPTF